MFRRLKIFFSLRKDNYSDAKQGVAMKWSNKGHEFDSVGYLLNGKDHIYIYGAKQTGTELCQILIPLLKWLKWEVTFIDADTAKQQAGFLGFDVLPPTALKQIDKTKSFVVICASEENAPAMFETAEDAGFVKMQNLFEHYYFLYTYISVHFLYSLDMVYIASLNIVPSTICNLNCKGCLNFNPYIKKHVTYELDNLIEDVDILFAAIDIIGRFQITGGEPLLYPNLTDLIKYIGGNHRNKIVHFELVTNGTIIPSDEVCCALKQNSVNVIADDYRKSVELSTEKFPGVIEKLKAYEIPLLENIAIQWFDLTPNLETLQQLNEKQLVDTFTMCENPYATIVDKSISACNYAHYASKAQIVPNNKADYFDLTRPFSKAELVEYRLRINERGYTELCSRCARYRYNRNYIDAAMQLTR
jgi:organic radical activating enzyme